MYLTPATDPALRHLRIKTAADYLRAARAAVAKAQANGDTDAEIRDSASPVYAYVNHGRWLINCECEAGVTCHPDWATIPCMACGRVHTAVIYPEDKAEIEEALDERTNVRTRNWFTDETVADLWQENAAMLDYQPDKPTKIPVDVEVDVLPDVLMPGVLTKGRK